MRVLFLPRWYPHRYDPMPGLFVQRQAEAVSRHCGVSVLYLHEDPLCKEEYEIDAASENGIHVLRIYYRVPVRNKGLLTRFLRLYRFFRAGWLGLRKLSGNRFDILHVHVLTRLGVIALAYRLMTGVPYVITEHWSRYYAGNKTYRGFLRKKITGMVVRSASAVIAVSGKLKEAMLANHLRNNRYLVIPNPVDMDEFVVKERPAGNFPVKKRMIHISCFENRSKNITGLLKVLKDLSVKRDDFECYLVGEGPDRDLMKDLAAELGLLGKFAYFPGLKTREDLVSEINQADFMVLSSHYETFASVVIEGLACGIPVVATDVGIVEDVINKDNGLSVPPGDPEALEGAVARMLDTCREYDRSLIRESIAGRFDNRTIGDALFHLYREVLAGKTIHS